MGEDDKRIAEVRGALELTRSAVLGVTDLVEAMHLNISRVPWPLGATATGRTRGLTGLVYSMIRGTTRLVGAGLDAAVTRALPLALPLFGEGSSAPSPEREAVRAALNGVLGDHLAASGNALATEARLRRAGSPLALTRADLAAAIANPRRRVVVLVHGFCMSDLQWLRDGHDHGAALEAALDCNVVHLHYNSGLRVAANGRALSALLEELVRAWPAPLEQLDLLGYSMGGLVARSALHQAARGGLAWPARVEKLLFLGTPHQGSPLARGGEWPGLILGVSPYSAPLAILAERQSAGLTDLRLGSILEEEAHVPLPERIACFAIAGTKSAPGEKVLASDGLVPVESAFGEHADPARALRLEAARRFVSHRTTHLDLLGSRAVFEQLRAWLAD